MVHRLRRLALFIDADNISLQVAPGIIARLSANWDVCYRRAYGLNLLNQAEVLREHSIVPVEVLNNRPLKNSTDFALVIDAIEELCLGHSDAICLVSADGDFTRLVQRIRERGKPAIVFGKSTTAAALRSACSEFYVIEDSAATKMVEKGNDSPRKPAVPSAAKPPAQTEAAVRDGLRQVFCNFSAGDKPVTLERFGEFLKKQHPKLAPPKFGLSRLRPFLERIGGFEIQPIAKNEGIAGRFRVTLPSSK